MSSADLTARVRAVVAQHALDPDAADLGLDSLTWVMLLESLERELGVAVPAAALAADDFTSLASLVALARRVVGEVD